MGPAAVRGRRPACAGAHLGDVPARRWPTRGPPTGSSPATPDLVLPSTAEGCDAEGCQEWPAPERAFALTELARRWVASAASLDRLADFAEARGLEWAGRGAPQSSAAMDLAAATVAWGLMDQPYDLPDTLAERTCDQLAADFQALTQASTGWRGLPTRRGVTPCPAPHGHAPVSATHPGGPWSPCWLQRP